MEEQKNGSFLQQNNPLNEQPMDAEATRLSDEAKIKEILTEQQKLTQLYNEVVVYIQQHPTMPTEEMIKYQTQLKQLSEYYQVNQEKLKTLGYSSVQVNKNVTIKKWSTRNLSVKTIFLWCAAIIFLFVLWLWVLSYYLASHPDSLGGFSALGIGADTAKSILSLLSVAVMMVILLLGVVILIVNTYRSFTVKNKPKGWYYAWILFWLTIIWIALAAGTTLISMVSNIDVQSIINPGDVVKMSMLRYKPISKWNEIVRQAEPHQIDGSFYVIAPVNVAASLFSANYKEYVNTVFANANVMIEAVQLDCWNGQTLPLNGYDNINFVWECFYQKKWLYDISLLFLTRDGNNNQNVEKHPIKTISVDSEILVRWINTQLTSGTNELSVGPLPAEVEFDADAVFRDLKLWEYNISWYWENMDDISPDKMNETVFRHTYNSSKVYYPKVRFHDVRYLDGNWWSWDWYSFPLRVTPSTLPVCNVTVTHEDALDYTLEWTFLDWTDRSVSDYSFEVIDKFTSKVVDTIPKGTSKYKTSFRFPGQWSYTVKMRFKTDYGEDGSCETDIILSEKASFNVVYDFSASTATSNGYEKINIEGSGEVKTINIKEIPTNLKLKISSIEPKTKDTVVSVLVDGSPKVMGSDGSYSFDISDSNVHNIKIKAVDESRWLEYEETLEAKIWLDDLVWKLSIIWDTIGFEPFTVTLDASASKLTDSSDQITYFTWDFGDGESQQKVSNWVVKHSYRFNYNENNGTFTPKVTVYTQKGRQVTVSAGSSIVVKKQLVKLDIYSTTHPLQEAKVGDSVGLALEFNGLPKKISWDFGDGEQPIECEGRTCSDVTKVWSEKWTYLIKVLVDFEDQQSVEQTYQFKIR